MNAGATKRRRGKPPQDTSRNGGERTASPLPINPRPHSCQKTTILLSICTNHSRYMVAPMILLMILFATYFVVDWKPLLPLTASSSFLTTQSTSVTHQQPINISNETVLTEALERIKRAMEGMEQCTSTVKILSNCSCLVDERPPTRPSLSSSFKNNPCCRRTFISSHKMGHMALIEYIEQEFRNEATVTFAKLNYSRKELNTGMANRFEEARTTKVPTTMQDYREVVIGRDLYATLVSGYLYHRSGRECWLDGYGRLWPQRGKLAILNRIDFEQDVKERSAGDDGATTSWWNDTDWPSSNGRVLCQYLEDEPEHIGMKAFTAYAMVQWMGPMLEVAQNRKESKGCSSRTLFLCLDDLKPTDPLHNNLTTSLYDFFGFQGMNHTSYGMLKKRPAEAHGTSHDPALRSRLKKFVEELDDTLWNGRIRKANAWFGCRSEIK